MSERMPTIATYRGNDPHQRRSPQTLALAYQEVLTAIVRLRANRQVINHAEAFRAHFRGALQAAEREAQGLGYPAEDVRWATFAVVAFLDESVLSSGNPALADWHRLPLQEELFGGHLAGETFFRNVQQILGRSDASDVADLLEVYGLCLVLGYQGRYGASGQVRSILASIREKIARIRGRSSGLSPKWIIPAEPARGATRDRWTRRLGVTAIALASLAAISFAAAEAVLVTRSNTLAALVQARAEGVR